VPLAKVGDASVARTHTGISEIDRVLGGGIVPGGALLLGGEPGVGKSTLLLQVAGSLAAGGGRVLVATAEESADQVGLRAERLRVHADGVDLVAIDDIDHIIATAEQLRPDLLIVDSIQTVSASEITGSAGGVAQIRECAARVIRFAKNSSTAVVLVGHVTKEGGIAGPKILEHMVDVVLYLEGDADHEMRMLRSLKNRYGATHLAGLFEMHHEGLAEVADPSAAFVGDWTGAVPGTVVLPTMEGRRPVLVEVQALVAPSQVPQPRRSVRGLEAARVHQLLAVLERHAGLSFAGREAYASVVGGIRVSEPAADLAIMLALSSSLLDKPLGSLAAWGEVGLTGEIRSAPLERRRREEVERMGITALVAPGSGGVHRVEEALARAGLLP
jgi:DNA repair protein RadA/Sms